jgi:DMSO/TMAO reductase YedYZ molybdopterin-dependent catalytic subunit
MAWSEEEVRAMPTMDVQSKNKQGETSIYTGVSIAVLLEMAGVQAEASAVAFTAGDGSSAEAQWAEVQACQDCIISFRNNRNPGEVGASKDLDDGSAPQSAGQAKALLVVKPHRSRRELGGSPLLSLV